MYILIYKKNMKYICFICSFLFTIAKHFSFVCHLIYMQQPIDECVVFAVSFSHRLSAPNNILNVRKSQTYMAASDIKIITLESHWRCSIVFICNIRISCKIILFRWKAERRYVPNNQFGCIV